MSVYTTIIKEEVFGVLLATATAALAPPLKFVTPSLSMASPTADPRTVKA